MKKKMAKKGSKKRKLKPPKVDGFSVDDVKKIRTALRKVWSWSYPRRLCIQRSTNAEGFSVCEKCKEVVPKVYPDHIEACGDVDSGYIERLFVPSSKLQALCKKCHNEKTRLERKISNCF